MKGGNVDAGFNGEEIAVRYLLLRGYSIERRNYRAGRLEVDIIARDGDCLVFVEVKLRKSAVFGSALESVLPRQLENIRNAARGYIQDRGGSAGRLMLRIDLVAIDLIREEDSMVLNHLKGIT